MASIKKASTLIKRTALVSTFAGSRDLGLTPMLVGPHGIGKSQIIKKAAEDLGGYCFTIEASTLGEKEITGLPFAQQNEDGTSEVRFIRYYQINKIWQIEKSYYKKATSEGFLGGTVKLSLEDGNEMITENGKTRPGRTKDDRLHAGEDNIFKFGEDLSSETKLKLIESGEVRPVFLFIDELNRTEATIMKEMMNIVLNRNINGYDLPWWVFIVTAINPCSQNSVYATNELDDAQLDRFLKIKVDADISEWVDYALDADIDSDLINAISMSEQIFIHREKGQEDQSEMSPSPRSWEMVSILYKNIRKYNIPKFFSDAEMKDVEDDLWTLIRGKVGEIPARTVRENINRKENNIHPEEILTLKALEIPENIVAKFNNQKRLTQKIIADNVVRYVGQNIDEWKKSSTKSTEKDEKDTAKSKWACFSAQMKQFVSMMDAATQILFVSKIMSYDDNLSLFSKVSHTLTKEVLSTITAAKGAIKAVSSDN